MCEGDKRRKAGSMTYDRLGVMNHMVLEELVQLVIALVLHEKIDHNLVDAVLHNQLELAEGANVVDQHRNQELVRHFL